MNRLHQVLIGVLVVQLVLIGVVFWPRNGGAAAAGVPLFGQINATDISTITISNAQSSVKFVRQGDKWVLPDAGDFPADATKLSPLAEKLAAAKTDRLITRTADSLKRLQVADDTYNSKIDFTTSAGASHTLYLGASAGGGATYVRVAGQNEVYQSADIQGYSITPDVSTWINPVYVSATPDDIVGLTVKNAGGENVFTKDAQGKWQMQGLAAGEQVNDNNVTSIATQLTSLSMSRPLGKTDDAAYGLAQPLAVVTFTTKSNNKTTTLTVGAKDPKDNTYVVKSSDSEYYVRVADYTMTTIVERKRAEFLVQPTPTPGPAAAPTATPAQ